MANVHLYYLEVVIYICLGASQVATMGDLTVRITSSVRGFYTRDENAYDRCMGRLSPRVQAIFVWLGYIAIVISAFVILIRANVFWS